MESNEDFDLAYSLIEHTSANVFLTGRAGTGKTTFLRALIGRSDKQIVVAAPTGIAAINAGGVTLHSLFQLDFGPFVPGRRRKQIRFNKNKLKMIRVMDVLVIDEIRVGDDNIYIFGAKADEVIAHYKNSDYVSRTYYEEDERIHRVVDFILSDEMKKYGEIGRAHV